MEKRSLSALIGSLAVLCLGQAFGQWSAPTKALEPILVKELPHDSALFTQGLLLYRGRLFESFGLYGRSGLREVDPQSGRVFREHSLPPRFFAEGLAIQAGKLVQLTWKEGLAFRYPIQTWENPQKWEYQGEGWGLTDWKDGYCMSNGSDTLVFRDRNFHEKRRLPVTLAGKAVSRINELETARNLIWANIWYSDSLVAIDPRNGQVVNVVDCSRLAAQSGRTSRDQVLNGIAHDPASGLFYLTGKNWPKLFVVRIP